MGQIISYDVDGTEVEAYRADPDHPGPGLVVLQEWWGLVDHIKRVCDRYAAAGFVAVAPDLYHGEQTTAPDEAKRLMLSLQVDRAAQEMGGAIDYLIADDGVVGTRVGVTGFCLGGGLTYTLAATRPGQVAAIAPFYGVIPWPDAQPDFEAIEARVQGHYAEHDHTITLDGIAALESRLRAATRDVEWYVYDGCHHGFFNDTREDVHDPAAASLAFDRVTRFFQASFGTPT